MGESKQILEELKQEIMEEEQQSDNVVESSEGMKKTTDQSSY